VSILALQCDDAGILARGPSADGSAGAAASPGYALLDGRTVLVGAKARDRARLKPRFVNNRFWDRLDTSPLPRPFPTDLTHADLVHAHLEEIWRELGSGVEAVVLALPGSYSEAQLGLTLGIARACDIPVAGMVDSAVAAAAAGYPGEHLLHLDVQLHRTVVTELAQARDVVRRRVETTDHVGLISLHDRWVKAIAGAFVSQTRFDPLHDATTEQALHDSLPDSLERLRDSEGAPLRMETSGRSYGVDLVTASLVSAVRDDYEGIVQLVRLLKPVGRRSTLLLSHRVDGLPGLHAKLDDVADTEVVVLPEGAAADGAVRHAEAIRSRGEAVSFVTRLPVEKAVRRDRPGPTPSPRRSPRHERGRPPTHLLHDSAAYPIRPEPLVLGIAVPAGSRAINLTGPTAGISRSHCSVYRASGRVVVEDHSTHGSFLNGQRIHGTADLAEGDRLRLGSPGIEVRLIRVTEAEDDGPPAG
jgi:hypothetical protein